MPQSPLLLFAGGAVSAAVILASPGAFADAPGDIDSSFGAGGLVVTNFNGDDYGTSVVLQPDGKIVVAGTRNIADNPDFALARYNADGTPDATFGTNGRVTTDFAAGWEAAKGVVVQADGKLVVGGDRASFGPSFPRDFALARYNSDGTLDATFGSGGKVITDLGGGNSAEALVLQSDGKLVVAGASGSGSAFALVRYLSDGSLDPAFGMGGIVLADFPAGYADYVYALVQQPDGKLLAGGRVSIGSYNDLALARFDSDGSLDASFGSGGTVTIDISITDTVLSLALQPDGKIVAAGDTPGAVVVRLNADGTLDGSFGASGIAIIPFAGDIRAVHGVVLGPGGEVIVALSDGANFPRNSTESVLVRLSADGTEDARFGVAGRVATQVAGVYDEFADVVLQPDAKLIIAGHTLGRDFALARYEARSGLACATMPLGGCKVSSRARGSSVRVRHDGPDHDTVTWNWKRGSATITELGNPLTGNDDYALCVYDESGVSPVLLLDAIAPAGGLCAGRPCWRPLGLRGYGYKDATDLSPRGIAKLTVKSGAGDRASIKLQGRGPNLLLPSLPFGLPISVQLQNTNGTCWEAVFSAAGFSRNSTAEFAGKSD